MVMRLVKSRYRWILGAGFATEMQGIRHERHFEFEEKEIVMRDSINWSQGDAPKVVRIPRFMVPVGVPEPDDAGNFSLGPLRASRAVVQWCVRWIWFTAHRGLKVYFRRYGFDAGHSTSSMRNEIPLLNG